MRLHALGWAALLGLSTLALGCPSSVAQLPAPEPAEADAAVPPPTACERLCGRLEDVGLLCGESTLGSTVATCVKKCTVDDESVIEGVDSADCAAASAMLPDALVLPCRCAPQQERFAPLVDGPLAKCASCHPEFVGDGGYAAVIARVDGYDIDESPLLCRGVGCNEHPGAAPWTSPGSCDYRTVAAWIADAAPPGDDCVEAELDIDCTVCGDPPPEPEAPIDEADLARFEAEVYGPLLNSCGVCHAKWIPADGPSAVQTAYLAALDRVDRDDPPASPLLQMATNQEPHGGGEVWTVDGCGYLLTLAWIAGDDKPEACP